MLDSMDLSMLLTFTWQWLREGRDEKGLRRLDELMDEALDPVATRVDRLRTNLAALGQMPGEAEDVVTDEQWEDLLGSTGMLGIESDD